MQKPNESLDDYVVKALSKPAEPPLPVSLRFTGEVEVLKPLARWERPAKLIPSAVEPAPRRLSWFHRSLAIGGGLAVAGLVLASAVAIGVSDATLQSETAQIDFVEVPGDNVVNEHILTTEEPLSADIFSLPMSPRRAQTSRIRKSRMDRIENERAAVPVRKRLRKAAKPTNAEPNHSLVSKFVPTTYVIYVENGFVRSRVEPWLTDRK